MKVLHIYRTYFPDPPGGLQEAIRQISMSTCQYGAESRIFALSPDPTPREIPMPEGVVTRAKSWAAPASCDLGRWDAVQLFKQQANWADVLHFHFPWPFADILHLLVRSNKPAVMTYHSDVVRQRALGYLYGPLMRRTLRSMSAVVATSARYANTSKILTDAVDRRHLKVIPLGLIDYADGPSLASSAIEYLDRLALPPRPYVLALGVLRYYKGLHTLIEAAPLIDSTIVIAGSGPEAKRLHALAAKVGASNVVFADQVSHEEKVTLLKGCKALVLPSHLRSEAFGMVLVEAAMFGKPMVCCEVGSGTSYVNQDGVTGFVVQPESPSDLADAVNRLIKDDSLALRMGHAARKRYESLFSGPALGFAYAKLYEEVLGRDLRGRFITNQI